jgi:hypothetical protein
MKETTEQKLRQLKLAELMLKSGIDCEVILHFKPKDPALRIRRKDLDAFLDSGATMKATR